MHRKKLVNKTLFKDSYSQLKKDKKEIHRKIKKADRLVAKSAKSGGLKHEQNVTIASVAKAAGEFIQLCMNNMKTMQSKEDFFRFIMPYLNQIEATSHGKEARTLVNNMLYQENDPVQKDMTRLLSVVTAGIGEIEYARILRSNKAAEDEIHSKQQNQLGTNDNKTTQVNGMSVLPFIPAKVDLMHLNNQGELFEKEYAQAIKQAFVANSQLTRIKVDRPGAQKGDYDKVTIIKMFNESGVANYYAIYQGEKHGKSLGDGATGNVKYIVNIDTNEWSALKVPKKKGNPEANAKVNQEADNLAKHKQLLGRLHRTPYGEAGGKNKDYYLIAMNLARGANLEKQFITGQAQVSDYTLHHIAVGMTGELEKLHNNTRLYHRDIKPEQFHYDPQTGKVALIDLGSAIDVKKPDVLDGGKGLSAVYMAPEHIKLYYKDVDQIAKEKADEAYPQVEKLKSINIDELAPEKAKEIKKIREAHRKMVLDAKREIWSKVNYQFSEKTDVYALGLSIGQLYGLTKDADPNVLFNLPAQPGQYKPGSTILAIVDPSEAAQAKIKDPKERDDVIAFLKKMTAVNPDDRPSMKEVSKFFIALDRKHTPDPKTQISVLLDINAYKKLSNDDQSTLIKQLKNADKVFLVETAASLSQRDKLEILRSFQSVGVITDRNVYTGPEGLKQVKESIKGHIIEPSQSTDLKLETVIQNIRLGDAGNVEKKEDKEELFEFQPVPQDFSLVGDVLSQTKEVNDLAKLDDEELFEFQPVTDDMLKEAQQTDLGEFDVDAALKELDQQQIQLEREHAALEKTEQEDTEFTDSILSALQADEDALKAANQDLGNLMVDQFIEEQQEVADFKQQATEEFADYKPTSPKEEQDFVFHEVPSDAEAFAFTPVPDDFMKETPKENQSVNANKLMIPKEMPPLPNVPEQAQKTVEENKAPLAKEQHMNAFIFEKLAAHRKSNKTTQDINHTAKEMATSLRKDLSTQQSASTANPANNTTAVSKNKLVTTKHDERDAVKPSTPKMGK